MEPPTGSQVIFPNMKQHHKTLDCTSERAAQSQVKDLNCTSAAQCSLSTILISPAPFDVPQTCITMTTLRILGSGKQAALPTALTVSVLQSVSSMKERSKKTKKTQHFQGSIYKNRTLLTFGASSSTTWLHCLFLFFLCFIYVASVVIRSR